ncbi:hypothetical protein ADIMK_2095 [Marinobacterium lacunae]|uniref:SnoaL-like domain-containing protein n=1 Tax=Marinobacterium lacunae TaxID=1232683 RepID=A0A081FZ38_9GAMM|nr:nuclear transport factor 2 family protein [Marinobacterium lacunae]KEA63793.1 hypothetical protein ADIMK_2095 [Marinobacterium lacunae]MBR9885309.1 nuclear transport factor 2 family protein [Oceanospirillales bacterium]
MSLANIVQRGWDAVAVGDFDSLVTDYMDEMQFIMPGQTDVVEGRTAFRSALNNIGQALPAGFHITGLRHIEGDKEVVSIVEWESDRVDASQLMILFKFIGDKIYEERWFVDTEQWRAAL